jgi:hypothetical protein
LASLGTDDFRALRTDQIAALTTSAVLGMSTDEIKALQTDQVAALQTNVSNYFTSIMGALASGAFTPIVIDTSRNGFIDTSVAGGALFDLDADGVKDATGWITNGDALLARDLNDDGQINDGSELFGAATLLSNGSKARDGYEAMAALDDNGDGWLDASDSVFVELKLWVDIDGDGLVDEGEMLSLDQAGVSAISTRPTFDVSVSNGNVVALKSEVVFADGSSGLAADVWFQTDAAGGQDLLTSLADALERYGQETEQDGVSEAGAAPTIEQQLLAQLAAFDPNGGLVGSNSSDLSSLNDPEEILRRQALLGSTNGGSLGQS